MSGTVICFIFFLTVNVCYQAAASAQSAITATLHISDVASGQDIAGVFFEGTELRVKEAPGGVYKLHADQSPATVVIRRTGMCLTI